MLPSRPVILLVGRSFSANLRSSPTVKLVSSTLAIKFFSALTACKASIASVFLAIFPAFVVILPVLAVILPSAVVTRSVKAVKSAALA